MNPINGIKEGLGAIVKPAEDILFGHDSPPPIPTDPEKARQLVDNAIGRQQSDYTTVNMIKDAGLVSSVLTSLPSFGLGLAYDPNTMSRLVTGNNTAPVEPYFTADAIMGNWLNADPRRQILYLRETDPLNKDLLNFAVENNFQHHDGLLANFKNMAGDILGRPIGGGLELLSKPAKDVELWYGTHFVWNDVADASLRQAMAKYTYEAKLNIKDWNMSWEAQARTEAQNIENQGLKGDAAAAAFNEWVKTDGQPKVSAYVADMIGQTVFDPLWLVPTHWIGEGTKVATKAIIGTEDIGKLGRLATAAGRSFSGEHSIKELVNLPELQYAERKLGTAGLRGSLMFLTERNPDRLADAALNRTASLVSGPLERAPDAYSQLEILQKYDEALRSGKLSDEAAQLFGSNLLEDPVLAEAHIHLKASEKSFMDGVMEGVSKNPEYLQASPAERAYLLLTHYLGNVRSIVRDGQLAVYPKWFSRRYMPLVAAQKLAMGTFTLSRPGFVVLNMANNFFTYMWHAAGHPFEGSEIFARSLKAELSTISPDGGHLPEFFKNLAHAANEDPVAIERTVVGNVSHQDILGQKLGYPFRLDDETVDVADAIAKAKKVVSQPLKDMNPRRFRDLVAFPVTAAGRVDRMTRRAAYYYNLKKQLAFAAAPERLLVKGAEGMKGGLLPDIKDALLSGGVPSEHAEYAENYLYTHMLDAMHSGKLTLGDGAAIRKTYLEGVDKLLKDTKASRLSAFDIVIQHLQRQGLSKDQALVSASELDDVMVEMQKAFDVADEIPIEQLKAKLDRIGDNYWTFDRIQADMTHTAPVLRPGTDYSKSLSLTEEGIRADLKDNLMHVQRFMDTKLPDWTGNTTLRRSVLGSAQKYSVDRLNRLAAIRKAKINALADGIKLDENKLWQDYFDFTDSATKDLYDTVKSTLSKIDQTNLKPIDDWYAETQRVATRHQDIIQRALADGTAQGWEDAGNAVNKLYRDSANRRAGKIFGWQPNEEALNLGHTRPSAAFTRQVDELITFAKSRLGEEMAKERPEQWVAALRQTAQKAALEAGKRGPEVARQVATNARVATDFVMLNYNDQYGIDNALQMIFPYEFFPTRTAFNWTRRAMQSPGAAAFLAKALLNPKRYAEDYGYPDRLAYRLPIPIPGLDHVLENVPIIGDKVKNANFGSIYWIDPLSVLFPMSNFRDEYVDEKKRSTPLGIVADWTEQNTPLSLSPFAKILGSITGTLDRDAWTNSLFNGGPFGIPMSAYGYATSAWLQTGQDSNVPASEQTQYSNTGGFTHSWLAKILGMGGGRYDEYHTERALTSLVASGDITADDAWEAIRTKSGPIWDQAHKAGDSEKFLSDFTGWLGFRTVGSLKGEQIRLGEQILYNKAAAEGKLDEFYQHYPEFELQQVASKGISDPAGQKQLIDNHFYFAGVEKYVNKPYQHALDQIQQQLDAISQKAVINETDKEQQRYLLDELQQIKEEQSAIYNTLDKAYPDRTKTASLNIPPKERALQQAAQGYYALQRGVGDGVPANETPDDFASRQQRYLDQFPARGAGDTELDWQNLFVAYNATEATYNLKINAAYDAGDFTKGRTLRDQKDKSLNQIHQLAEKRITRADMELYLASKQRILTPSEQEWEQANSLFDIWMSYVSDSSPLTNSQKAAVSAYFRQDPLLQKHYNVQTLDIRQLNGDQLLALARRRDIKAQYNALQSNSAKIDYIMSVKDEYNQINAMLGLPQLQLLDYRPAPPDILYRSVKDAQQEFGQPGQNVLDYINSLDAQMNDLPFGVLSSPDLTHSDVTTLARADGGMSLQDITRYIDPTVQRGY